MSNRVVLLDCGQVEYADPALSTLDINLCIESTISSTFNILPENHNISVYTDYGYDIWTFDIPNLTPVNTTTIGN